MRVSLSFAMVVLFAASGSLQADTVEVVSDRDLGLYKIEGAPVAAPGVLGTQRGAGGRMDINGTGGPAGGANESALLSFDLSSAVPAGHEIVSASLEIYSAHGGGWGWDVDVAIYPMGVSWTEGAGDSFPFDGGGTGFPWGHAAVGDSVYSFQETTDVGIGEGAWGSPNNLDVAYSGTPWGAPGAMGIGTDMLNRRMFDDRVTGDTGGGGFSFGSLIADMSLNAEGVAVLNEWADGSLTNQGMHLFFETDHGDPRLDVNGAPLGGPSQWRAATHEYDESGFQAGGLAAPRLVLETRAIPEPSAIVLLVMGLAGLGGRIRKR